MKILNFPQLRQTFDYDCGAKVLQAVLVYYGTEEREDHLIKLAGTNQKNGTSISSILKVLKKFGLKTVSRKMNKDDLKNYLDKKIPVILALQAWPLKKTKNWEASDENGHYVVATGYDKEKILLMDPSVFYKTYLTWKELEKRWHDSDSSGKKYINHGIAVFGKKPAYKKDLLIHMG